MTENQVVKSAPERRENETGVIHTRTTREEAKRRIRELRESLK